jgi:hypothetical protein
VHVKPDGSGTVEEVVVLNSAMLQQMEMMISSMAQGMGGEQESLDAPNIFDEAKLRSQAANFGEGVTYVSGEEIKIDAGEGYRAVYSFSDINLLRINQNPGEKAPSLPVGELGTGAEQFVTFEFTPGVPNRLAIMMSGRSSALVPERVEVAEKQGPDDPALITFDSEDDATVEVSFGSGGSSDGNSIYSKKESGLDSQIDPQMMAMVQGFFKDMRFSLAVEFAGEITDTNATHRDGSRVTLLELDFGALMQNPETLAGFAGLDPAQLTSASMEDMKALIQDLPGIKVDLNEELYVTFQ